MLREFELGLADALGSRLPPPLQGAVDAAPARPQALVVASVGAAEPVDDEMRSRRPERVPGAADPRRVLRLRCSTTLEVRVPPAGDRNDQLRLLDRVIYLLGDPALADGSALRPEDPDADPGFLLQRLQLQAVAAPGTVTLSAEGWFWPVGQAGAAGVAIRDLRLRHSGLPLRLQPAAPALRPGGAAVDLAVELAHGGTLQLLADADEPAALPFGEAFVSLVDGGGRPGAGTLDGGAAGPGGARRLAFDGDLLRLRYTPPAAPATDFLVVQLADAAGAPGTALGRLRLAVRSL